MRADLAAFISFLTIVVVLGLIVRNYKGSTAVTTAAFGGLDSILRTVTYQSPISPHLVG